MKQELIQLPIQRIFEFQRQKDDLKFYIPPRYGQREAEECC